jgi:hypothetical protein
MTTLISIISLALLCKLLPVFIIGLFILRFIWKIIRFIVKFTLIISIAIFLLYIIIK